MQFNDIIHLNIIHITSQYRHLWLNFLPLYIFLIHNKIAFNLVNLFIFAYNHELLLPEDLEFYTRNKTFI